MQEQVVERKALVAAGDKRADAFTIMVKANEDESSKYQLDDQELVRASSHLSLLLPYLKLLSDREHFCASVCGSW